MKKLISILLLVCLITSFTACKKQRDALISGEYFNTKSYIYTYADRSDKKIQEYTKTANELLGYYHRLFDIYNEYQGLNNIKTINDNAGVAPVKVDAELVDFLEYCKELYTLTKGKTNIMLGSVLRIWHSCREEADRNFGYLSPDDLPTEKELTAANTHTGIELLVIDKDASTVYIADKEASIDVGAIAKGYAVDRIYERLKNDGADSVILNIGGNVRTIGLKNGEKWTSGIRNPDTSSEDSIICRIRIGDNSIVTSGDYERYFTTGFEDYHHIIDPDTLMPSKYFSSVSIITESSALADALSTALFCMSYEDGLALVESIGGIEVIWIDKEFNLKATDGIDILPIN